MQSEAKITIEENCPETLLTNMTKNIYNMILQRKCDHKISHPDVLTAIVCYINRLDTVVLM